MSQRSKRFSRAIGAGRILKLTFEQSKFVLHFQDSIGNFEAAGWTKIGPQTFETSNMTVAARLRSVADSKAEYVFKKLMLLRVPIPPGGPLSPIGLKLFPFQAERGIPHILSHNKTYLAHQPGLGKSAQAICAISWKPGRALFIVPSFLKITWAREITKWFIQDFPEIEIVDRKSVV